MEQKDESWVKDFDDRFDNRASSSFVQDGDSLQPRVLLREALKDFIRSLLHSHNESLKEKILGLKITANYADPEIENHNDTIDKVLSLLTNA